MTFIRFVDQPFDDCMSSLERLWERRGMTGWIEVGRSLVSDGGWEPGSGHRTLAVCLDRGRMVPRMPMELHLLPWAAASGLTFLELLPNRAVRPGGRYYRAGHAFLNQFAMALRAPAAEQLSQELAEAV